jgi:hypothetical protein
MARRSAWFNAGLTHLADGITQASGNPTWPSSAGCSWPLRAAADVTGAPPGITVTRDDVRPCELPADALLQRYRASGAYADCYTTTLAHAVSHAEYVQAFYTTAVFKLERLILRVFAARPSTGAQAAALARGALDRFAAWSVEASAPNQLLLCDFTGRTRSWLMVAPLDAGTRLYFGSAVVPVRDARSGESRMGFGFRALLGFHKLYSRLLLSAARARLALSAVKPAA